MRDDLSVTFLHPLDQLDEPSWEQAINQIADGLVDKGMVIVDNMFSAELCGGLVNEFDGYWRERINPAGIGRAGEFQQNTQVRRDKISWLEPTTENVSRFLRLMEQIKRDLNRLLYLGLFEYEAHFALYQPGDFYRTHRDAFRGQAGRKLSTVLYLNQDWKSEYGGELGIYADDNTWIADVLPAFGRMAIFLSEEFPHEVKPATVERKSIAGWFRVNEGVR